MGLLDDFEDESEESSESWDSGFDTNDGANESFGTTLESESSNDGWESAGTDMDSLFENDTNDTGQQGSSTGFETAGEQKKGSKLKYAVIAIVFVLIVIAVLAIVKRKAEPDNTQTTQLTQTQPIGSIADNENPVVTQTQPVQQQTSQLVTESENWIEFTASDQFIFSERIKSSFTVTDIKYYAKIVNDYNDKEIKVALTGAISGLVGTYEMDIPYDKCAGVQIGTTFDCYYKIAQKADLSYKVVTSVDYE